MIAPETVTEAARRGIFCLEHLLICADICRALYPKARAGDPEAAALLHMAVAHMRDLGMSEDREV